MKVLKPTTIPFPNNGQFIRGSTATYIEDGILKTAAINEPRWQDGKSLLEGEGTNYAAYSNNFTLAWSTDGFSTLTPDAETSPSGLVDSTSWVRGSNLYLYRQPINELIPSDLDVFSIFIKANGCSTIRLSLFGPIPTNLATCDFDLNLKTKTDLVGSDGEITDIGSGWFRLSLKSGNGTTPRLVELFMLGATAGTGFFLYGAQFEKNNVTSYIPTTTTPVTRQADICIGNVSRASTATYIDANGVLQTAGVNVPRIQNGRLLIEKSSSNVLRQSNSFENASWDKAGCTVNDANTNGPLGTNTASTFTFTDFDPYVFQQNIAVTQGSVYSASFWIKGVDSMVGRSAEFLPWYNGTAVGPIAPQPFVLDAVGRFVSFNFTATSSGTISFRIDLDTAAAIIGHQIVLSAVQLELSDFSTSYIPTTTVPVTRQADIHTAGLVYTNATDSRPLWSSATTYSVGQIIRYNNNVYESLQASNLNKQPDTNPTWWLSLGADNISAAFDGKVGSKTTATDKLRMIVYPGNVVDAVGYLETNAVVVNTSAVDSYGNSAYSNSTGFTESNIANWYDYFFVSPLADPATQVVHQGIPSLDPGLFVGIEMIRPGTVEVGSVLMGYSTTIGKTQYGVKAGIVDYSKKESDEFGNVSIVERPYSKRMQGDVYVNNYDLNKVQRFLYNIRATPVLWMASDNPELTEVSYVYGFYKDFSTTISYPDVSMCNLDIEGLI